MQLAKPQVDIGVSTNNIEPMLHFWQNTVGLKFDHLLPVSRGVKQYRHDASGSIVKINHYRESLSEQERRGYRELLIARDSRTEPERLLDPDGNAVCLVPRGYW